MRDKKKILQYILCFSQTT